MKTRILPTIVLVFLMLGCGEDRDPEGSDGGSRPAERATTATRPSKPTKVLVTSADASLPDGCHPRQIAGLVIDFIDAFNSGDQERLARLFFVSEGPSPPDFSEEGYYPWSWYSVSEVGAGGRIQDGFVTYDQRELLSYFAQRHRKGEHLELIKVSSTQIGLLGEEGNVGIVYVLTRGAQDLRARGRRPGAHSFRQRGNQLREPPDLRVEHGDEGGRKKN